MKIHVINKTLVLICLFLLQNMNGFSQADAVYYRFNYGNYRFEYEIIHSVNISDKNLLLKYIVNRMEVEYSCKMNLHLSLIKDEYGDEMWYGVLDIISEDILLGPGHRLVVLETILMNLLQSELSSILEFIVVEVNGKYLSFYEDLYLGYKSVYMKDDFKNNIDGAKLMDAK